MCQVTCQSVEVQVKVVDGQERHSSLKNSGECYNQRYLPNVQHTEEGEYPS